MNRSVLLALLIVAVTGAWVASGVLTEEPMDEDALPPPALRADETAGTELPKVRVEVSTARERARDLVVTGRTMADRQVTLKAETDSRVDAVLPAKGDTVAAGDLVVRLAINTRETQLDEAKALLAQRELEYAAARHLQRSNITSRTSLAEAKANLDAARSRVADMELDLQRTEVRAPFNGSFQDNLVEQGDYVQKGEDLAVLVDLDPITVVGHLTERDVGRVTVGGPAAVTLADGTAAEGRVTFVSSVAESDTRTFPVEVDVPNPDGRIPQGMTAEMRLPLKPVKVHLVSPAVLALGADGAIGVKIVDENDLVRFEKANVAGDGADGFWISGLPDEIRLITVGQAFVEEGARVRPMTSEEIAEQSRRLMEETAAAAPPDLPASGEPAAGGPPSGDEGAGR